MLQRSTHESEVVVPAIPALVQPGEVVDWPDPISGFEKVEPEPVEPLVAKSTTKKRSDPAGEESTS